jgi:hypothetical protein
VCRICGKEFYRPPSAIANGAGKYCSSAHHYEAKGESEDHRFLRKIVRGAADQHWVFVGACHPDGYGRTKHRGTSMFASRKAYILAYGDLTSDQYVLHRCDFPPCCNPRHLRIGTVEENLLERNARSRQRVYPDNHQLLRGNTRWTTGLGSVLVRSFRYDLERGVLVRYELPSGRTVWLERDVFLATFAPCGSVAGQRRPRAVGQPGGSV